MVQKQEIMPGLVTVSILVIAGIIYFLYDTKIKSEVFEKWNMEYPTISVNEKIDGTITNVIRQLDPKLFRNDPHSAWITLDHSLKRRVKTGYELTTERQGEFYRFSSLVRIDIYACRNILGKTDRKLESNRRLLEKCFPQKRVEEI